MIGGVHVNINPNLRRGGRHDLEGARLFERDMEFGGVWRYYSSLQYKRCRLPPDLDDTVSLVREPPPLQALHKNKKVDPPISRRGRAGVQLTASLMTPRLKKIVIVNTSDQGGGAERMSMAVLDGFNALGVDTFLLVGHKRTDHPKVITFNQSPFFPKRRWRHRRSKIRRRIKTMIGLEDFEYPYSHRILELTGSPPDLVLCHNLHGNYFDLRALAPLSHRVPVALRLFDTWLFSGHCAYSLGCPRWQTGCGRCPDLSIPPAIKRDATRINWWRKQRTLRRAKLFVSAETQWMLDRAGLSLLAPTAVEWTLIPGGIDLETFSPGSRESARSELGLDPDRTILLYVANAGPENPYKDFATVLRSLPEIASRVPGRRVELLVIGSDGPEERVSADVVVRRLGYIRSPAQLAAHYRAADVYVHAALEETFGNSVVEALACGAPVVTAAGGGVLEVVDHERTALVVPPRDAGELAEAIGRLLAEPSLGATLGAAAAASACARFDRRAMIANLYEWCCACHSTWHESAAAGAAPG